MGANELVIRISGDIGDYQEKLKAAEKQTQALADVLDATAKYSAIGFAALSAEIVLATREFGEAEASSRKLSQALLNQGLYSEKLVEDYNAYATAVSKTSGFDDDTIKNAQAVAQAYLGRTKITQELTQAIADLAEGEGITLANAAEKLGRTVGTTTNAFARQGLEMDGVISTEDRLNKTLEFTNRMYGGMAAEANKGIGGVRGLKTAFSDLNEEIGQRFAASASIVIRRLTEIVQKFKDNGPLIDFTAKFLAGAAAFLLFTATASKVVVGIVSLQTALTALGVTVTATRIAITLLAGATGIGLLVVALGTLGGYLLTATEKMDNFKNNIPGAREEIKKLKEEIQELEKSRSVRAFDYDKANDTRAIDAKKKELAALEQIVTESEVKEKETLEKKNAALGAIAIRKEQIDKAQQQRQLSSIDAQNEALRARVDEESTATIENLQKEADLKAQIAASSNATQIALLEELYEQQVEITNQQMEEDLAREAEFEAIRAETNAALREQGQADTSSLNQKEIADIQAQAATKAEVEKKIATDELKTRMAARAQYLEDEKKFGAAYATINAAMHSAIYNGTKKAFGELAVLQTSSNSTLKGIGKAAAIANIVIKTAESAMNIFNGFSSIPIVGIGLGIAGAAAAVAFGAEQVSNVTAAASGGLLRGGIPGVDSIPVIAQDMEVITPAQNFEELIGSVRAKREAEKLGGSAFGGAGGESMERQLSLLAEISAKLDSLQTGVTNIVQGDVLADDAYINRLFEKMSDALQFGNAKLRGVEVSS